MNKEDIISSGLLELYAMGLSSPEETQQVEQWLNQYPEIKQEIEAIELSLESYAKAEAITPSTSVKDKIFAEINKVSNPFTKVPGEVSTSQNNVNRLSSFYKIAAAAMFVLLIGSIVLSYSYYHKYQTTSNNLQIAQNNLKDAEEKAEHNQQVSSEMQNEMNIIGDKNSLPVVLNGTPHAPDAVAKIYWIKTSGDVYVDPSNLPNTPTNKQYQLWAIVDGKPVSAGTISTSKGVYRIQKMKSFGRAQAFAITLEKAGGSSTPTMDQMFVISKV